MDGLTFTVFNRTLIIDQNGERFRVLPSSETSGVNNNPASTTWRWEHEGQAYRVQIQTRSTK